MKTYRQFIKETLEHLVTEASKKDMSDSAGARKHDQDYRLPNA